MMARAIDVHDTSPAFLIGRTTVGVWQARARGL